MANADREPTPSKVDWSTPYDAWLLPILNRARHAGSIEFRAIPSEIQLEFDKVIDALLDRIKEEGPEDKVFELGLHDGYRDHIEGYNHSNATWRTTIDNIAKEIRGE